MNKLNAIYDKEARKYILSLINFFGSFEIEKRLNKYKKSLNYAGPIYKRYYLKHRHPWWNSLISFYELESKGKSIKKNLDLGLKVLAADGKKISILQKMMPDSVRNKFKKDLLDDNRASDFLFELDMAWHYLLNGHGIDWYEDNNCPDFIVNTQDFDFNVECKRITVDGSRKVWRKDFYRLIEKLIPEIEKLKYMGKIDIELNDRLHSSDHHLESLSRQIIELIYANQINGAFEFKLGYATLNLKESDDKGVNIKELCRELFERKPHEAHGAFYAGEKNGMPINPIEITLKSKKSDKVLLGIKDKVKDAAIKQLPPDKPGLISCFLEDIDDLTNLASDSGLQIMSNYLLDKNDLSHIAGISFSSEERVKRYPGSENFSSQGLLFRNENCIFKIAHDFKFLSKEK
ncbi:hypothetical protein DSCW_12760 [Desulfosarcina widdelii]|uniref:Uncharacterized protein n=1 Tax=Desulfosarcina widdelii TaxID=947919 RepID=A0A5K7Z0V6_9BACT|nr:hypothetical protein [Desulfosarcina widdelii]BBO73859.1 hypothetical protein DSCW_12760 [Desulfosarcina widdelii]